MTNSLILFYLKSIAYSTVDAYFDFGNLYT